MKKLLWMMLPLIAGMLRGEVKGREVAYEVDGVKYKGYLVVEEGVEGKRPGVVVVHEWWGHNAYARRRAEMLAAEGYVALALDMYGEGRTADHPKEAGAFAQAAMRDLAAMEKRFRAAVEVLKGEERVDGERIAAMGYCFGGAVVLNMARRGVELDGVVSFHGSLAAQVPAEKGGVRARVLVYNGAEDVLVPAEQIDAFRKEMDAAGVGYRFVNLPGAKHSFTNPDADAKAEAFGLPLAYDEEADRTSWEGTLAFFREIWP